MSSRFSISLLLFRVGLVVGLINTVQAYAGSETVAVIAFERTASADLVLVGAGLGSGLRQGMTCLVSREGRRVAQLLLVEARQSVSSALIVGMAPGESVRRGDAVSIKTLKL